MATVKPIPDEYPQIVPYLCVEGASDGRLRHRTAGMP
jgi:hypothetical protein